MGFPATRRSRSAKLPGVARACCSSWPPADGLCSAAQAIGGVAKGEVLFVDFNRLVTNARVTLNGEVTVPGTHALGSTPTVAGLLRDPDDLGPNAYTLFAVIVRHDPNTNFLKLVPFSIQSVFNKTQAPRLVDNDFIYVFNYSEIQALSQAAASQLFNATQSPSVTAMNQQLQLQAAQAQATSQSLPSTGGGSGGSGTPSSPTPTSLAQMASAAQSASASPTTSSTSTTSNSSSPQPGASTTTSSTSTTQPTSTSTTNGAGRLDGHELGDRVAAISTNPNQVNSIASRMGVSPTSLTNLASDYRLVFVRRICSITR